MRGGGQLFRLRNVGEAVCHCRSFVCLVHSIYCIAVSKIICCFVFDNSVLRLNSWWYGQGSAERWNHIVRNYSCACARVRWSWNWQSQNRARRWSSRPSPFVYRFTIWYFFHLSSCGYSNHLCQIHGMVSADLRCWRRCLAFDVFVNEGIWRKDNPTHQAYSNITNSHQVYDHCYFCQLVLFCILACSIVSGAAIYFSSCFPKNQTVDLVFSLAFIENFAVNLIITGHSD